MWSYRLTDSNELYHYGVLGMKWGVHRGRAKEAYGKASKKLSKISTKVEKFDAKSRKMIKKAQKYRAKAAKNNYKSAKQMRKAVKWCNQMDKAFQGTTVKRSKAQIELGKEYVKRLNTRTEVRSVLY